MKKQIFAKIGCGVALGAFASLGLIGTAHADWSNPHSETGISSTGYFSNFGPGGKAPEYDQSQYDKVQLGSLSATLYAPKAGSMGPMRDEEASMKAKQDREIQSRLGPIGGRETP